MIQVIIKQPLELIDKVLVYLLSKSFVLNNETIMLEVNVRIYREKLDALEKKIETLQSLGFIDRTYSTVGRR